MSTDIWLTIHAERQALANDLTGLTPEQWNTASLCSEWSVHDVLAHLLSLAKMTPGRFIGKFARPGSASTGSALVRSPSKAAADRRAP